MKIKLCALFAAAALPLSAWAQAPPATPPTPAAAQPNQVDADELLREKKLNDLLVKLFSPDAGNCTVAPPEGQACAVLIYEVDPKDPATKTMSAEINKTMGRPVIGAALPAAGASPTTAQIMLATGVAGSSATARSIKVNAGTLLHYDFGGVSGDGKTTSQLYRFELTGVMTPGVCKSDPKRCGMNGAYDPKVFQVDRYLMQPPKKPRPPKPSIATKGY